MLMRTISKFLILPLMLTTFLVNASNAPTSQEELRILKQGNKKYLRNPKYAAQRARTAPGQNPPTVILSCADSRVPPEIIFSQGIGEMFTCRVAGNVADPVVIDSIEFAVHNYDVSVVQVMGHTRCGAVEGAIKHLIRNGGVIDTPSPGHLNAVLIPIETAIVQAGINIYGPDALEQSTRANIAYQANQLISQSTSIAQALASGQIIIVGSEYNVKTGKVKKLFTITQP